MVGYSETGPLLLISRPVSEKSLLKRLTSTEALFSSSDIPTRPHAGRRAGWYCRFVEEDKKTPLPRTLTFTEDRIWETTCERLGKIADNSNVAIHSKGAMLS